MTDKEVSYRAMARQAVQKLTDHRSVWEKAAPRMVPDYEKVLQDFAAASTQATGTGSKGYTDAKDQAEHVAVAAAAHQRALGAATAAYRPLVGTPRGQTIAGSALRTTARKLVGQLRTAFGPIDTRLDSLGEEDEFKLMVAEYQQAQRQVAGGHGPHDPGKPVAGK